MPLITLQSVDYSVGGPLLLERVDLAIEPGERIALIGRNGAGKSTLLKLLSGELKPDDGEVRVEGGRRIARLEQEVPQDAAGSVFDVVAAGLGELGALLADYHHIIHADEIDTDALAAVQSRIEAAQGWALDRRVVETLERLQLDGDRVRADFTSAQPEVRQALESSLPRLREMLGQQGFELAHAGVGQQSHSPGNGGGQSRTGPGDDVATAADDTPTPAPRTLRLGLLDAYA